MIRTEVGAEKFNIPGLFYRTDDPYPAYNSRTGKRNLMALYRCPNYTKNAHDYYGRTLFPDIYDPRLSKPIIGDKH